MNRLAIALGLSLCAACGRPSTTPATTTPAAATAAKAEPSSPAAAADPRVDPLAGLDADIEAMMAAHDVPGLAIAIVHEDAVVLARGYGVRERGKPEPVDADTIFAIASNTKAFLATAVGMLVEEGKLDWDDRVIEHLPDLKLWDDYATRHMRIRDLLCHRSGLSTWAGDVMWIGAEIDTPGVMSKLRHVPPDYDLHERYGYSNLMFVVAGEVIRAKTGQPWDVFVQQRLLTPLGMSRTSTTVDGLGAQDDVAVPHAAVPGGEAKVAYLDVDAAGAAAALNSSVADMSRWLRAQLHDGELDGKPIVPAKVVADLRVPHTPIVRKPPKDRPATGHFRAYGLGWVLADHYGRLVVTHGGGLPGMISRVMLVPEENLGIVVLTNSESSVASALAKVVLARYVGADTKALLAAATKPEEPDPPKDEGDAPAATAAPPSLAPKAYAGRFHNALLGAGVVRLADDRLSLALPDHGGLACPLEPQDKDTFRCAWEDATFGTSDVHFDVERGKVRALRFKVRPDFIDPLEYRFTRGRR